MAPVNPRTDVTVYYHGGAPGLEPGDLLLPRSETGVFRHYDVLVPLYEAGLGGWLAKAGRPYPGHSERVYMTTDRDRAEGFAAGYSTWLIAVGGHGAGTLYEVTAEEVWPDPTAGPGAVWAHKGVVTAVTVEHVPHNCDPAGLQAMMMMHRAYRLWRDKFNGGADHPMVAEWKAAG